MPRFPLNTVVNFRSCGECQACCTVVGVHELAKPAYTRCQHQCHAGCAVYAERPPTCQGYQCLYSTGILQGGKAYRPDKLGVVIDLRAEASDTVRPGDRVTLQVWEVWPGALRQPRVARLLEELSARFVCTVQEYPAEQGLRPRSGAL